MYFILGIFKRLTTIKDIAREANVSSGTVDRVLHNRGGVSLKTSERIKKFLKNKNFKINQIASSIAMKKHLSLATLIPLINMIKHLFWKSPHSEFKSKSRGKCQWSRNKKLLI